MKNKKETYKTMNLPDGYCFKQTNNQLIYQYFDGSNISTISKWKAGLKCNIENIRYFMFSNVPEIRPDDTKLIDYIDGLEYEDALI